MINRRTIIVGGAAAATVFSLFPARSQVMTGRSFDWKGSEFLSGGTANVPGSLPEPVFRSAPNCVTTGCKTLGPCYMEDPEERYDISEGFTGLPVRIAMRVVDAAGCEPIEGANVDIWHANARGIYSGEDTAAMCTMDDAEATASEAFRGYGVTDSDGRVEFLTVYPGWYRGRTVHIHMRILVDGEELLVSQLLFDDALSDLVYADHPDYAGRGERDTDNAADNIFASDEYGDYVFDVERADGVLLASYTIGVDRQGKCEEGPMRPPA